MGRLLLAAAAITMLCGYCVRPIELEPDHEPRRAVPELSVIPKQQALP